MVTRDTLHAIIDQLPEDTLAAAQQYLEGLRAGDDPLLAMLANAPEDDEPETEEEAKAAAEGWAAWKAGDVVDLAEIEAELNQ